MVIIFFTWETFGCWREGFSVNCVYCFGNVLSVFKSVVLNVEEAEMKCEHQQDLYNETRKKRKREKTSGHLALLELTVQNVTGLLLFHPSGLRQWLGLQPKPKKSD